MLPLASSFRFLFCNFVLSVFGAIIRHVFNSPCRIQADESETITPIQAKPDCKTIRQPDAETISVLASNSSRCQLEPTTQIHGFIEESETTNCFVEELFYASPSSGNQFSSGKYFWEFSSETENFIEIFRDEEKDLKSSQDGETLGEDCSLSFSNSDSGSLSFDEEYIEIELEPQLNVLDAKVLPVNDWREEENEDSFEEPKETEWDEKGMEFEEEEEEEELLQEHQDLIKQLKMELRNSRTGGLPTVLEEEEEEEPESISSTSVQALRPLKQVGNFEHKEHFKEIHKVYKTYAEKMRKLDISNTQTNYAIGFVKLKDQISPIDGRKSVVKSLFSHKLRPGRAEKRCTRLMRDLEMVYVGHLCLSWEILHWQYRKAIQLQRNDSRGTYQYSQVVNEFQLFCILIQRFIEDEWFCSSRIENYAKNRLLVRSLLQVPAIREDCVNDKKPRGRDGENTISTAALVSIIEDSMRVFREFLQTDKDKCGKVQLHYNPFDAQMMMEIRTGLRKKEKRLKDIVRSGNCILNKLQSQRIAEEGNLKNELLIAEVQLKLVWRVVSMSRLTEKQLIWCHEKLHQVNFVNRKLVLEPSFLLFPCSL